MFYVGIDYHKRYTQLNAIDEKESHPCFVGPLPYSPAHHERSIRQEGG